MVLRKDEIEIESSLITADNSIKQRDYFDRLWETEDRDYRAPLLKYLGEWRVRAAAERLLGASQGRITTSSSVLFLCAAEGHEGSVLCDLGFTDVTVSDFSEIALAKAAKCDPRLKTARIDASNNSLPGGAYDVVAVQDGLHHLQDPVHGFTEMLRLSRKAAFFLEPHDSLSTKVLGRKWEQLEGTRNYVFRWTKRLVQDVASSYLVTDSFLNLSFSFWYHGDRHAGWRKVIGNGPVACRAMTALKVTLDSTAGRFGNQFCGMVLRSPD